MSAVLYLRVEIEILIKQSLVLCVLKYFIFLRKRKAVLLTIIRISV